MFERTPQTSHDVVRRLEARYHSQIATGQYQPFIYPWGTVGAALVILYLLIDHRRSPILRHCRFLAFAFICWFAFYTIRTCRALNPASAFGVGLINAWSILWCSVMLVFNDAQADFKRIERKERSLDRDGNQSNGTTAKAQDINDPVRKRTNGFPSEDKVGSTQSPAQRSGTFAWQAYPVSPFLERMDWVADIFCNFRGMGWNWRISGLPPPPKHVQEDLKHNNATEISDDNTHVSRMGIHRYQTKSTLLRHNIYIFCRNYLILDLLKTLIAHDPYFWGLKNDPRAPGYLPQSLKSSPVAINSARLLISLSAIGLALQFIFSLGPIFFVGILGPSIIGARGEPWMYPAQFGSFSIVFEKGLAGWWGGWWHQTFRYGFEASSTRVVKLLGLDPKSQTAKFLSLAIAFALSGCLHACGSYTQIGDTRPLMGPLRFFLLQILGVTAQTQTTRWLGRMGVTQRLPGWVRKGTNFAYTHVWFYYTAPLLVDDFAAGGIWLFEPLPISPLRGLGFGSKEDGWWCWSGQIARWHSGKNWWDTGIAL